MAEEKRHNGLLGALRVIFLILFSGAMAWGLLLYVVQVRAQAQAEELTALREAMGDGALYELNSDYVGWMTVYGAGLEVPVVRCGDDEYYLAHDFYRRQSSLGCTCLASAVRADEEGNILARMRYSAASAAMRSMTQYLDVDFFTEHGVICWEYDGREIYYELFALLTTPEADGIELMDYVNQIDSASTQTALETMRADALYWRDVPLDGSDRFLMLELCDYPRRGDSVVLCAQRLGG